MRREGSGRRQAARPVRGASPDRARRRVAAPRCDARDRRGRCIEPIHRPCRCIATTPHDRHPMIDLAILGLLQEQDLHGYELRKRATELAGLRPAVSFGSLYPALSRLEAAGAVRVVDAVDAPAADEPALPLTGSLAGEAAAFLARTRSRAERTGRPRGRRAPQGVRSHRGGPAAAPRPHGRPGHRRPGLPPQGGVLPLPAVLPAPRALRAAPGRPRRSPGRRTVSRRPDRHATVADRLDHYLRSLREHDTQTIQHDIAWLDELIADERAALTSSRARPSREEDPPS